MITIDHQDRLISIAALGEFTLADFKEFEQLILYKIKFSGSVSLIVDLREMISFTVDMAWEEVKFSHDHALDFDRIAVITDSQWIAWSAWLQQLFVNADTQVFSDADEARAWIGNIDGE